MGSIRSSITRMLRATTVSHRAATTNTLIRHHHIFKPTSPLTVTRSHPFNQRIPNHHLLSTFAFQREAPRASATKTRLRQIFGKLMYGMCLGVAQICILGVYTFMFTKIPKRFRSILDHESGTKFKGSLTNFVHKGHTVVIDGFVRPLDRNGVELGFEYFCIATEVLSQPDQIVAAMKRNSCIIAEKRDVAEEEKLNVSGEDREVLINWCTTWSGETSNDVADPSKGLVLEGRVNQSVVFSVIAKLLVEGMLKDAVKDFKGLADALLEGHSVVVVRSVKPLKHGFEEEDKWGKRLVAKVWDSESHISAKVLDKHDEMNKPHNAVSASADAIIQ